MSKNTFINRFSLIIKCLEKSPATYEQINNYLKKENDSLGYNYDISLRTLQRDISFINSQMGYEIVNEKKGDKRYHIINRPETIDKAQRLLDAYQTISIINASQDYADCIFLDTRRPEGLDNFPQLLHAIKNLLVIKITHQKFYEDRISERGLQPFGLKESRGRWYLIAIDNKDERLKTFGLDRIKDIEITNQKFKRKDINIQEVFNDSFGIITTPGNKAKRVIISSNYERGQYIKSYPLHHSQELIREDVDEMTFEFHIAITYDFVMELLSYGEEIKIVSPVSLVMRLKDIYSKALNKYQ